MRRGLRAGEFMYYVALVMINANMILGKNMQIRSKNTTLAWGGVCPIGKPLMCTK